MRKQWMRIGRHVFISVGLAALFLSSALAQTSVALSLYGAFSGTTNGNGLQQSPANAAGGLFELRHIANPIFGFEGTYSYNRANQKFTPTGSFACPTTGCPNLNPQSVKANAHELTVDWVPSIKVANLRPFGVFGLGALIDRPVSGQSNTKTSTKAVYVYGAGVDWGLLPHIGLRLQYRGNVYDAPELSKLYGSSKTFTHTSEPMIGVYFSL